MAMRTLPLPRSDESSLFGLFFASSDESPLFGLFFASSDESPLFGLFFASSDDEPTWSSLFLFSSSPDEVPASPDSLRPDESVDCLDARGRSSFVSLSWEASGDDF